MYVCVCTQPLHRKQNAAQGQFFKRGRDSLNSVSFSPEWLLLQMLKSLVNTTMYWRRVDLLQKLQKVRKYFAIVDRNPSSSDPIKSRLILNLTNSLIDFNGMPTRLELLVILFLKVTKVPTLYVHMYICA